MNDAVTAGEESGRPRKPEHSVAFWVGFGAVVVVVSRAAGPSHRLAAASAPARPLSDCALASGPPGRWFAPARASSTKEPERETERKRHPDRDACLILAVRVGGPTNSAQSGQTTMSEKPIREDTAQVHCSTETKNDIRGLKRGGETYDGLLGRLLEPYDPAAARSAEGTDDGC